MHLKAKKKTARAVKFNEKKHGVHGVNNVLLVFHFT